jgi:hypothetical protein
LPFLRVLCVLSRLTRFMTAFWNLVNGASLEFGAWDLELSPGFHPKLPTFEVLPFHPASPPPSFPLLAQNPLLLHRHFMQFARTSNDRTLP